MARTFRHWTPRYIINRLVLTYHERQNPGAPWLTKQANDFLANWLTPNHIGLEWGSGRSTIWFAKRVAKLDSVEHDPAWHSLVEARLKEKGISNVQLFLLPAEAESSEANPRYVRSGEECKSESFDFILVDGMHRDLCAATAVRLLKPGGLLVIDDAERYFPSNTYSPGARQRTWTKRSLLWQQVADTLSTWRCMWTSDGVSDTALFFKPVILSNRGAGQRAIP